MPTILGIFLKTCIGLAYRKPAALLVMLVRVLRDSRVARKDGRYR